MRDILMTLRNMLIFAITIAGLIWGWNLVNDAFQMFWEYVAIFICCSILFAYIFWVFYGFRKND